jgi:hypothetical protein
MIASMLKKQDFSGTVQTKKGNGLVSALTEDSCISGTRFYLKGRQEGFDETKKYEGEVGGKL